MEFFRISRTIPFMRYSRILNAISVVTFVIAVGALFARGLNLSIEFTGGTVMEVSYAQAADIAKVRGTVEGLKLGEVQVQNFGSARDVLIRLPVRGEARKDDVVAGVFGELCKNEGGKVSCRLASSSGHCLGLAVAARMRRMAAREKAPKRTARSKAAHTSSCWYWAIRARSCWAWSLPWICLASRPSRNVKATGPSSPKRSRRRRVRSMGSSTG